MEARVHHELSQFLRLHDMEESISNIDEIILSYLVGIVELASQGDDAADFEDVLDMMNAYLPGFEGIDRALVIEWMFGLTDKLANQELATSNTCEEQYIEQDINTVSITGDDLQNGECESKQNSIKQRRSFPHYDFNNPESLSVLQTTQSDISVSCKLASSNHFSQVNGVKSKGNNPSQTKDKLAQEEQKHSAHLDAKSNVLHKNRFSEKKNRGKRKGRQLSCSSQESQEDSAVVEETDTPETEPCIRALQEMFPSACSMEARHCLQLSGGDMDQAAQLIIDRQESGQAIAAGGSLKTKKGNHKAKKLGDFKLDDDSIKLSLLKKYSFVDTEEDKRTYRPPPPKGEAKKLVRYRDGQIVSMKGERFSEIKKNTSEMKS
ncbi:CUE domain-containing protein 2 [Elysia marginata]|uniref:CUE domain-containing protein 2 n=1 Tax=Elysia marginata TaxID=1093978 RepID=A0AAV4JXA2_9GAST|nr:CUE domain-containing protein 2 [Elysia marginata]